MFKASCEALKTLQWTRDQTAAVPVADFRWKRITSKAKRTFRTPHSVLATAWGMKERLYTVKNWHDWSHLKMERPLEEDLLTHLCVNWTKPLDWVKKPQWFYKQWSLKVHRTRGIHPDHHHKTILSSWTFWRQDSWLTNASPFHWLTTVAINV